MIPINEIFETLQGEAFWTGTPAVFIRLQGCGVGCPWCDTKHTWTVDPDNECSTGAMLAKETDSPTYAKARLETLMPLLGTLRARHIVITGGEPCQYDLTPLTAAIIESGRTVQIETSGTEEIRCHPVTWITVSPKIGMPGGKEVRPDAIMRANEIKMPVGRWADVTKLKELLDTMPRNPGSLIWLQPLSASEKATRICIEAATANGWRVSIQTHRFIGVR